MTGLSRSSEAWTVDNWKVLAAQRRERLFAKREVKVTERSTGRIISLSGQRFTPAMDANRRGNCRTLYDRPIGPRHHHFIYAAPIGPQDVMRPFRSSFSVRQQIASLAAGYGLSLDDLRGIRKNGELIGPRHAIYWHLRNDFNLSLSQIGRIMNRDHTTILHGVRRHQAKLDASGWGRTCSSQTQ